MKILAQHRLPVFIALSLAIHLVWFINQKDGILDLSQQDNRRMSVHISESKISTPPKKILAITDKNIIHKPAPQPKQQNYSQSRIEKTERHKQDPTQLTQAKIIGHVRKRMQYHFTYPRLARRQGWQGQVLLGFQVDHTGSIQHIHVKQSSGYAILDNSAITALHKIGRVENNEAGFFNKNWQLEIPIIYRLEG